MEQEIRSLLSSKEYDAAFERMLEAFQHKVLRLALSILRDRSLAEEAAQESFLRAWRALPQYRGDASVSTWLYTITRNSCLSYLRSPAARKLSSVDAEMLHVQPPRPSHDVDLAHLLAQIPDKYRQAITLFHMQEKSYEEVAEMLGIPLGTVKTYLHRGRKMLAELALASNITKGDTDVRRI